jgi:DNA mismatch endonuclease (patch repair protein)
MKAVKSKRTKLEDKVSKELWRRGYRFRRNEKSLYGKPDISIKKYQVAIFIDSCFWHGCELHARTPKSNVDYWLKKIQRNIERDVEVTKYYRNNGWHIFRIWEHQLNDNFGYTIELLVKQIEEIKKLNCST